MEAEILLAFCLNKNRAYLRSWPEKSLTAGQIHEFQGVVQQRHEGKPIAYITGYKEFWDLTLRITPAVLIPRPETEHLVELALEKIPTDVTWRVADIGTGSGAIALAIAKHRPLCQVIATDISTDALHIAQYNAQHCNIKNVQFRQGAWFEPLAEEKLQMIVSNPPYIAEDDPHLQQGDLRFEPAYALSSGENGLAHIRHIVAGARDHLAAPAWLMLEHGYQQGDAVLALLKQHGFHNTQCHSDYAQRERVTVGQRHFPLK